MRIKHWIWLALLATVSLTLAACVVSVPTQEAAGEAAPAGPAAAEEEAGAAEQPVQLVTWRVASALESVDRKLVEAFNESHPGIEVQYDAALAGLQYISEGMQKLRISLNNQSGPDFMGDVDLGPILQTLVDSGQVMDLTDAYEQYGWDEKIPAEFVERATIDGRIYAVPMAVETVGVYYNKDLFEQLNLAPPETYEEYLEILQVLTDNGYYGYALGLAGGFPSAFMVSEFMYLTAGSQYAEVLKGNQKWTECEQCLEGLQVFQDLVEAGYTNPEVLGIDQDQANDLFFQGQTGTTLFGPWFVQSIRDAAPDFEVGFFYMPPINPESDIKALGGPGGALIATKFTEHPDAVLEFFDWYLSEEGANLVLNEAGLVEPIPFTVQADDPLVQEIADATVANIDAVGLYPAQYLDPQVFNQLNQLVQGMVGGQLTPEQVLEEMQKAYESYLQEQQ